MLVRQQLNYPFPHALVNNAVCSLEQNITPVTDALNVGGGMECGKVT